jgi:hypothetical protein|tara:strand:- start:70 stop:258 length:189 start_codon:yes stop_codon:yes gene_type:complete
MSKSKIDSIIIDLILEHYNMKSLQGNIETMSSIEFDDIVKFAQEVYYKKIMTDTPEGQEGSA